MQPQHTLAFAIDPQQLAQHEAGQRSMETLMNCYCREVAQPQGQLHIGLPFGLFLGQDDWPQSVHMALRHHGGRAMHVHLPLTGARILTVVEAASITGNYRYRTPFYGKASGTHWTLLHWEELAGWMLRELSQQTGTPPNDELLQQIHDSVTVTAAVLQSPRPESFSNAPLQAYIDSEQSLAFGHPFHPAPKSRQGVSHEDMLRYSPEMGARFPLHYFAVRREYLLQQSVLELPCDQIIAQQAPRGLDIDDDHALIPAHPWQARYLLQHESVTQAIREGKIRDLGPQGEAYFPTSSIRTLFHPDNPYFYKCSLNIRITNCVRKNAVYELEGALQVTRIMRELLPSLQQQFPGLQVMEEPAFLSVDLKQGISVDLMQRDKEVTEGFGMILRRSFAGILQPGVTPLLAGALFGNHFQGEQRLRELLVRAATHWALPYEEAAAQWFSRYVEEVMYPVLHCYFAHGVIFEPHLQNVVIGVTEGEPLQVFLRDFEGVKLVRERYDEQRLSQVSPRAREALWYSEELGWKRVAYCLFVNNFCEAINHISAGNACLEQALWTLVRHHLQRYQIRFGDAYSRQRLKSVLNGEPFPGKTNLLNRFFKRPDRETTYLPIANPLGLFEKDKEWN